MTDLVSRLRIAASYRGPDKALLDIAADEITRLQKERDKWRRAYGAETQGPPEEPND